MPCVGSGPCRNFTTQTTRTGGSISPGFILRSNPLHHALRLFTCCSIGWDGLVSPVSPVLSFSPGIGFPSPVFRTNNAFVKSARTPLGSFSATLYTSGVCGAIAVNSQAFLFHSVNWAPYRLGLRGPASVKKRRGSGTALYLDARLWGERNISFLSSLFKMSGAGDGVSASGDVSAPASEGKDTSLGVLRSAEGESVKGEGSAPIVTLDPDAVQKFAEIEIYWGTSHERSYIRRNLVVG